LYVDGDVGVLRKFIYMMLVDIHLCIADKRHPHDISATKVHRIGEICKRIKEKMVLLRKE